jgi:hypothetical protein
VTLEFVLFLSLVTLEFLLALPSFGLSVSLVTWDLFLPLANFMLSVVDFVLVPDEVEISLAGVVLSLAGVVLSLAGVVLSLAGVVLLSAHDTAELLSCSRENTCAWL